MRRIIVTTLVALVLATVLLCPISEMFDRWDHTAKTGKDTESTLMLVAECAGAAIAVVHAGSAFLPSLIATGSAVAVRRSVPRFSSLAPVRYRFPESPPALPLRI